MDEMDSGTVTTPAPPDVGTGSQAARLRRVRGAARKALALVMLHSFRCVMLPAKVALDW